MAGNSIYPGFIKLFYTSNGHIHTQLLPVYPVNVGGSWMIQTKGITEPSFHSAVDSYVQRFKALFHTTDSIDYAELWTLDSPDANPVFQEAYQVGEAGTNNGADVPNSETVYTFRCTDGSLLKTYAMETANLYTYFDRSPLASGSNKDFADWMVSDDGWVQSRAGGRPVTVITARGKINDVLRKKYGVAS